MSSSKVFFFFQQSALPDKCNWSFWIGITAETWAFRSAKCNTVWSLVGRNVEDKRSVSRGSHCLFSYLWRGNIQFLEMMMGEKICFLRLTVMLLLGAFTFGRNAWTSILLLFVVQTTYVAQIWISSCSCRRALQKKWSGTCSKK